MLLKEIGKMAATATGRSPALLPDVSVFVCLFVCLFCFIVFVYTILTKFNGKLNNFLS